MVGLLDPMTAGAESNGDSTMAEPRSTKGIIRTYNARRRRGTILSDDGAIYRFNWRPGVDHPAEEVRVHFDIVRDRATGRRMAASVATLEEPHERRPLQEILEDYPDRGLPRTECLAPGHYKG
jgi:hypothetical protein